MPETISNREFNQNISAAKKAANEGPVIITDHGKPAHALMTYEHYSRFTGAQGSTVDMLGMPAFYGRILPVDAAVVSRCTQLMVPDSQSPWDALIAATALAHNLTVVTRNTPDFQASGVQPYNPWS